MRWARMPEGLPSKLPISKQRSEGSVRTLTLEKYVQQAAKGKQKNRRRGSSESTSAPQLQIYRR